MIKILAILGILLSIYAFYIEKRAKKEKNYKPICEIGNKASCTQVLTSNYGKMFGMSNSLLGIAFYALILILTIYNQMNYVFYLAILAILSSIYLIYVMKFKIKKFCLVCTLIHIINLLLLIVSYTQVYH